MQNGSHRNTAALAMTLASLLASASTAHGQTRTESTCTLGQRVEVNCKTARRCEDCIGKCKKFDEMKSEADGMRRDLKTERARLKTCELDKADLVERGRFDRARVLEAEAKLREPDPYHWTKIVGWTAVFVGSAWVITEALVDDSPSPAQLITGASITIVGGGFILITNF